MHLAIRKFYVIAAVILTTEKLLFSENYQGFFNFKITEKFLIFFQVFRLSRFFRKIVARLIYCG